MCLQIIRLRRLGELVNISKNRVYMLFQCIQRVLKVLTVDFLLGGLVIRFASHIELVCRPLIVVLQNFVEEDVPDLRRNFAGLGLKQQVLEIVTEVFNLTFEVHGLAKDGCAIIG